MFFSVDRCWAFFCAGFRQGQHEGQNRDDERDRLTFFFRLDREFGGFRHRLSP